MKAYKLIKDFEIKMNDGEICYFKAPQTGKWVDDGYMFKSKEKNEKRASPHWLDEEDMTAKPKHFKKLK